MMWKDTMTMATHLKKLMKTALNSEETVTHHFHPLIKILREIKKSHWPLPMEKNLDFFCVQQPRQLEGVQKEKGE